MTTLDEDLRPLVVPIIDILARASAVHQQQAIEILVARHACAMQDPRLANVVVDALMRHAKQLVRAHFQSC